MGGTLPSTLRAADVAAIYSYLHPLETPPPHLPPPPPPHPPFSVTFCRSWQVSCLLRFYLSFRRPNLKFSCCRETNMEENVKQAELARVEALAAAIDRREGGASTTGGRGGEELQSSGSCCSPPFGDTRAPKSPDVEKKEKLIIERRSKICPQIFDPAAKRRRGRLF